MGQGFFMLNEDMTLMYRIVVPQDGLTSAPINLMDPEAGELGSLHIHNAPAGAPGGIVLFLQPPLPTLTDGAFIWEGTTAMLTDEQKAALQSGQLYANLHTETNLAGEIRGQIVAAGGQPGCGDSSRVFFNPASPGVSGPVPFSGCRILNEGLCAKGWQFTGMSPFQAVSCFFRDAESGCVACGPNNETSGFCTNSCAAQ